MQDVFLNGLTALAAPPVPVVMGLTLRPFSLGHSVLLEAIDSPFSIGGPRSVADLSVAVWLCSMPYVDGAESLQYASVATSKAFDKWGKKWGKRGDFQTELNLFTVYLDFYSETPSRWNSGDKGECRTPWQWSMLNALSGGIADPVIQSHILNMPLNAAICQACAIGESNGDDSLMTEYEEHAIAELETIAAGQDHV